MRLLVTGGAGYVGSHTVKLLHEQGHEVVVLDSLEYGYREALPDEIPLLRGDLRDRGVLNEAFENFRFDGVIHFAGLLNVGESVHQPQRYYDYNVIGTLNLINAMLGHGVRRLVFSSSCAVHGNPPRVPITEDMPKNPISPYGRTKLIVEMALQDLARTDGLGSVALRYFNAAGAAADGSIGESRENEYHLIPVTLLVAMKQRKKLQIFGTDYPTPDGTAVRDYVHVDDLAQAHLLAVQQAETGQAKVYGVGTGRGVSVREVIETARQVSGKPIPAEESPRRAGDPAELYADSSLIRRELGWQPRYTQIRDIIASAWNWHKKHPRGYQD